MAFLAFFLAFFSHFCHFCHFVREGRGGDGRDGEGWGGKERGGEGRGEEGMEGERRGGERRGVKMLLTYRHTDRYTDPLTKWVVEELSLLKKLLSRIFSLLPALVKGRYTRRIFVKITKQ